MVEQISTPEGFEVIGFQDGPAALEATRKTTPHLIIADYHLDNMTFSGFCKEVHKVDSLSETYIISLVSAGDRLEEAHLKSLGVKALLKKPFQPEQLLELIKELDSKKPDHGQTNKKKRRVWPPVSSATDSDDDEGPGAEDEYQTGEIEAQPIASAPLQRDQPMMPASSGKSPASEPEEAMKGLLGQLLQSMSERAEKTISEMLPGMIAKNLAMEVAKAVKSEVEQQVAAKLTHDSVIEAMESLVAKELPKIISSAIPDLEPIIRQTVREIATPRIAEHLEHLVRDHVGSMGSSVPALVQEHIKTFDGQIQEEVRKAASREIEKLAEELVRVTANDQVRQTVQQVVPDIAEEQIRTEIKRLSEAA